MQLSPLEIDRFRQRGFAAIDRLIDDSTVAMLRRAYDELLNASVAAPFDRQLGDITRQVMYPALTHPVFDDNAALQAGIEIAKQLYGAPCAARTFDMLIYKPPGHPHATPWHQDHSYSKRPVQDAGVPIPRGLSQFWVALDDADLDNGCMCFLPGYHEKPLLPHEVVSGDAEMDERLLAIVDVENQVNLSTAVPCPLAAGGCTIHTYGTPHYTPPNRTKDRPRRAYIFNIIAGGPEVSSIGPTLHARLQTLVESTQKP